MVCVWVRGGGGGDHSSSFQPSAKGQKEVCFYHCSMAICLHACVTIKPIVRMSSDSSDNYDYVSMSLCLCNNYDYDSMSLWLFDIYAYVRSYTSLYALTNSFMQHLKKKVLTSIKVEFYYAYDSATLRLCQYTNIVGWFVYAAWLISSRTTTSIKFTSAAKRDLAWRIEKCPL